MTHLSFWYPQTVVQDLGLTLLHFLWQGIALAALLQLILSTSKRATVRHNWAVIILAAMMVFPIATFLFIHGQKNAEQTVFAFRDIHGRPSAAAVSYSSAITSSPPWLFYIVGFWSLGVAVLSVRALGGWLLALELWARDVKPLPTALLARFGELQKQFVPNWPIRFMQSNRVHTPVVMGWFRPIILVPVSLVTGLSLDQLDALIVHELAHIRRLDAFTNVLLMAAETILFYHPAIWWVTRHIRVEREHCCDDIAASICEDPAFYVEALTSLGAPRIEPTMALAASGGSIRERAARLLALPDEARRSNPSALIALVLLGFIAATAAVAQIEAKPDTHSFAKPKADAITRDAYDISNAIQHDQGLFDENKHVRIKKFADELNSLTRKHGLKASYIVSGDGRILAMTKKASFKDPNLPSAADLSRVRQGVAIELPQTGSTVSALIRLPALNNAYLLVATSIDACHGGPECAR